MEVLIGCLVLVVITTVTGLHGASAQLADEDLEVKAFEDERVYESLKQRAFK